jgi:glycogen operon protein
MLKVSKGSALPLGSEALGNGVNFSVYAPDASAVLLCIYDESGYTETDRVAMYKCEGGIWSLYVEGISKGALYGYRVDGDYDLNSGKLHNINKLLLDPYAKDFNGEFVWSERHFCHLPAGTLNVADNAFDIPKSKVANLSKYNGKRPFIPWQDTLIYECHVKGSTYLNNNISKEHRGKFLGICSPEFIKHLKKLGVTTVELLPVQSFISEQFLTTKGLKNYWGYNTFNFFVPHKDYLVNNDVSEFQQMVEILHKSDIEVILDVVFNHTAEAGGEGPTLSLKGFNNPGYYRLVDGTSEYINDTGCGNTINIDDPFCLKLILDSLRHWVDYYGVDGFRFDLASILGRTKGGFTQFHSFFQAIHQDPILSRCKLIAEPWDIGPGGYQLGAFPPPWREWNDKFRDIVRQFWQGEYHVLPELAKRIHGSNDLFEHNRRGPLNSVNFITSHDGFTLYDWVSYEAKSNFQNGENNQDGHNENYSFNCGCEGLTDSSKINTLRLKNQKNALITQFFSCGLPMICGGTELSHSQSGNNNAYCQDNEISWLNWEKPEAKVLTQFISNLVKIRNKFAIYKHPYFVHQDDNHFAINWFDENAHPMDPTKWHDSNSQFLMCKLDDYSQKDSLLLILNANKTSINVTLPISTYPWTLEITSEPSIKPIQPEQSIEISAQSSWVFSINFEGLENE